MEAVVFDIDGTLLESAATDDALFLTAVRQVLGKVTVRASWGLYTQFTARGIVTEILRDNGLAVTPPTLAAVRDRFVASVGDYLAMHGPFPEVPGARAFVAALQNSAVHRVAYATGGWHGAAVLKLSTAACPVDGVPLAASDDCIDRQRIMLHALRQLDGPFEAVTYYGDGHWDAVAAQALGWQFVPVGSTLGGLTAFPAAVS